MFKTAGFRRARPKHRVHADALTRTVTTRVAPSKGSRMALSRSVTRNTRGDLGRQAGAERRVVAGADTPQWESRRLADAADLAGLDFGVAPRGGGTGAGASSASAPSWRRRPRRAAAEGTDVAWALRSRSRSSDAVWSQGRWGDSTCAAIRALFGNGGVSGDVPPRARPSPG